MKAMLLSILREAFDDPDWLYQIKCDGFRGLAYVFGGRCQLVSRKGHIYSAPIFNRLGTAIATGIKAKNAVIDGEICALGSDGRSIFTDLLFRKTKWAYFYAFDLLWLNGKDFRTKPLFERKAKLRWLLSEQLAPLLYLDHIEGEGKKLFDEVCKCDMEGVVAKWKNGLYVPNSQANSWIKIKNPGYSQLNGRGELFKKRASGALLDDTNALVADWVGARGFESILRKFRQFSSRPVDVHRTRHSCGSGPISDPI